MPQGLKIIRYLTLGGIFLIPLTALIVTESLFFPFITGKNFYFRILVEIIFCFWLILAIYDKRYRPKKSIILYLLSAFVLVLILSTVFSVNPYKSFWSNYERMEGLITFLHLFAYFLVLGCVLNSEKLWKIFFHTSLGVSLIVACYGILQLTGTLDIHQSDVRLDATMGNASYLAIYMVFHIFIALWYFLKTKEWYKWFYLTIAFLETIVLYHTATRGAILGFVGGLLLSALLITVFSESKKIKTFSAGFLVLIILVTGLFLSLKNSDFVKNSPVLGRFAEISLEEKTTQSRFVIWQMSWEGFKEKPILGWGLENYNLIFNKYYKPILWKQEPWFDRAHNVFFDRLTTNGILGLITYLALFGSVFYYLLLQRKKYNFSEFDSAIICGLLAAYFFHNIFVFDNLLSLIIFFSLLAYINFRTARIPEQNLQQSFINPEDYKKPALSAIAIIASIFILYSANIPGLLNARALLSSFKSVSAGKIEEAYASFEKALSYNSFGISETREHFSNFASQAVAQQNVSAELKEKIYNSAAEEMKKQVESAPQDIRYMVFLAALYNKGFQYDEAIKILEKTIELSSKKQQLYFELGSSYLNIKQYEKAEEVLRIAFELDPSFGDARKIYAVALVFAGKVEQAENLLQEGFGKNLIPDERLIRAYVEINRFDRVAALWEKMIELNPTNAQYRVNLAASYLEIGERGKCIEQLQKAIELEPKFKEQGEYYINEIRAGRNP
ncbi:O-antigen ligase family protein [Patescibacteria group bacterium]|nr:O-antigen ligase family protein [Patescibacteria group bacterium]